MDDEVARDIVVKMFAIDNKDDVGTGETITQDGLRSLLMCAYHISMDHYSEGPQMCLAIGKTLKAVVDGCFHTKTQLSIQYVSHWLGANCPRLILPIHRYAVHSLATSYRVLESDGPPLATGKCLFFIIINKNFRYVICVSCIGLREKDEIEEGKL